MASQKLAVTNEEFIETWQTSNSTAEVADKIGWEGDYGLVYSRAAHLRRRGVPLKKYKKRGQDWEALAELARSFVNEPVA